VAAFTSNQSAGSNVLVSTPVESELGLTANEPNTIAVRSAIEQAVIEIVDQGDKSGLWKYKTPQKQ
jgi:curli biogenesis system outer membrane secretion channel CsgG